MVAPTLPVFPLDIETGPGIEASRAGARLRLDLKTVALRTTGTGNVYRVDTGGRIKEMRGGIALLIQADRTNTGPAFLVVDQFTVRPLTDAGGAEQAANRIVAGRFYQVLLDDVLQVWRVQAGASTLDEIPGLIQLRSDVAASAAAAATSAGAALTSANNAETGRVEVAANRTAVANDRAAIAQIIANGVIYATQADAEAGVAATGAMSPQRVTQHFQSRIGPWLRASGFLLAADQVSARTALDVPSTGALSSLASDLAAVQAVLNQLGADSAVADVYDESTTVGLAASVIVAADQPVGTVAIQNLSTSATVTLEFGGGSKFTLPPLAMMDQKGIPAGAIRASATADGTPLAVFVGNNTRISPNAVRRATALIRAMDAASTNDLGSTFKTSPAYEAAYRKLYYELDRVGMIQAASGLFVLAAETAAAGLVGWRSLTGAVPSGGPAWFKGKGYAFDGVDDFLNTGRMMSDGAGVTAASAGMAAFVKGASTGASRYVMSDGGWGIGPNVSASTWAARIGATAAETVAGAALESDLYAWRDDANAEFVALQATDPVRYERAGLSSLLARPVLIGCDSSTTSGVPKAGTFWNGTAKVIWFGRPIGVPKWREARTAINTYLDTVGAL